MDREYLRMADTVDVEELLGRLDKESKVELDTKPEVVDCGHSLNMDDLAITARKWHKLKDIVCVAADLKNSTKLGIGKHDTSTARIYQASTGGVVDIFDKFQADFIQIQGDGVFAIFWGDLRYERAMCSGITIKTFSLQLVDRLESKWPELPETGYKVGVASNRVLVKKVGTPRNPAQQEPIWAGKPVNFATKCAQSADRHELVVTGSLWDWIEKNDYLALSCPCGGGPSANIWSDKEIEKLPEGEPERQGRMLSAAWCKVHGKEFCDAVMNGKKIREEANVARKSMLLALSRNVLWHSAQRTRESIRARQKGLVR
jgi:class 3 adenylate cyclase